MFTKSPDYIIADCGCPEWTNSSNASNNSGNNIKFFSKIQNLYAAKKTALLADKSQRLLPLRETLTDYYARLVNKSSVGDPAQYKQLKNQRNEVIKIQKPQSKRESTKSSIQNSKGSNERRKQRVRPKSNIALVVANTDSDLDGF